MKLTEREYKALIVHAALRLAELAPNLFTDREELLLLHQRIGEIIDEGFPLRVLTPEEQHLDDDIWECDTAVITAKERISAV